MKKFIYMCLVLPALTVKANIKETSFGPTLALKSSATIFDTNKENLVEDQLEGECYFIDETGVRCALPHLKYHIDQSKQLVIDFHLNSQDEDQLKGIINNIKPQEKLITMINDYVISDVDMKETLMKRVT